jgi:hypothetical protein
VALTIRVLPSGVTSTECPNNSFSSAVGELTTVVSRCEVPEFQDMIRTRPISVSALPEVPKVGAPAMTQRPSDVIATAVLVCSPLYRYVPAKDSLSVKAVAGN